MITPYGKLRAVIRMTTRLGYNARPRLPMEPFTPSANPIFDAVSKNIAYPYTEVFDGLQGLYSAWYLVMPAAQQ